MRGYLIICICLLAVQASAEFVQLKLSTGWIRGKVVEFQGRKAHAFKGIPFAQPPLGPNRFRGPKPVQSWPGVFNTIDYRPACMSNTSETHSPQTYINEDCLYVNIWADSDCMNNSCPVIFYIHGGGFLYDSAIMFNETEIVKKYASRRLVYVIPAYRLGIFGFADFGQSLPDATYNNGFRDPEMARARAGTVRCTNLQHVTGTSHPWGMGTSHPCLDLVHALHWVNGEIDRFGGDPSRVTVFGNSGGGGALGLLISSPRIPSHLFQQAFLSSGIPEIFPSFNRELTNAVSGEVGCASNLNFTQRIECMRNVPAAALISAQRATEHTKWHSVGPQTDDDLLPAENMLQLMETWKPLPLVLSVTVQEMRAWSASPQYTCRCTLTDFNFTTLPTLQRCTQRYANDSVSAFRESMHATAYELTRQNVARHANTYMMVFAQPGHDYHADDMAFFNGLHYITNMTDDDRRMDQFYPKLCRRFFNGQKPIEDWIPVDEHGRNYYYLNMSGADMPRMVEGGVFDMAAVRFWRYDLKVVEEEAIHNGSQSILMVEDENTENRNPRMLGSLQLAVKPDPSTSTSSRNQYVEHLEPTYSVPFWHVILGIIIATFVLSLSAFTINVIQMCFGWKRRRFVADSATVEEEEMKVLKRYDDEFPRYVF